MGRLQSLELAAKVLSSSRVLGSLSPSGMVDFVRTASKGRPGPHLPLLLHASNRPSRTAVSDERRRLSWGQLQHEVNQLALALRALGVRPGERVAIMMRNCCEWAVAQHACTWIGAVAVQVGYRLKPREIAYILEHAQASALIYQHDYTAFAEEARAIAGMPERNRVIVTSAPPGPLATGARYEDLLRPFANAPLLSERSGAGGVMVYTSGTTGKPKGAHRSLRGGSLEPIADLIVRIGCHADERHLVVCPLYHSGAMAFYSLLMSLGASAILLDHFDEEHVLATVQRERITSAFLVPTMLARLAAVDEELVQRYDTSSLQWVCSAAAPLPSETARRFQARFGPILWNAYAATEVGFVSLAGPSDHADRPSTVGQLLRGNSVRLLDESGKSVETGAVGELHVRNGMLIDGYHGDPEATRASIRDGYFSVGDLARIDGDGYLYLEGRKSDMIISGGVNLYPREIEDYLVAHPDIVDCAIIGVEHPEWGEAAKAYVVLRRPGALSADAIAAYCKEGLADYKRPREIEFVRALPRNPTGKILKRVLREQHQAALRADASQA